MTSTSTQDLALRFLELTDTQDWPGRETLMSEDCEFVLPFAVLPTPAAASAFSAGFTGAFEDARHHVAVIVSSGDTVAVEGTWIGAHTGPLPTPDGDVPATGKVVNLPFTLVGTVSGDRFRSVRIYLDQLGFLAQLGLVPVPQPA